MAGYTRQSSYADGDIIDAADSNNEFNQVLAAFVNTSGHKHDGTSAPYALKGFQLEFAADARR